MAGSRGCVDRRRASNRGGSPVILVERRSCHHRRRPTTPDFALLAYNLNWQTVFYLGYGDGREFDAFSDRMQPSARQVFAKISYALQR